MFLVPAVLYYIFPYKLVLFSICPCNCWLWNFSLKPPNNLLCKKKKKADKKEEGKILSKVVLTFLEMAFLLGFMNACGEIILELKKNYRDHQIQVPYFIKAGSHYPIYQLNQKNQSTVYLIWTFL